LKELELLYVDYNHSSQLGTDPLGMVDPALAPEDFEIVSFLVAGLSYGRVEQIRLSSRKLLEKLAKAGAGRNGCGIADFLKKSEPETDRELKRSLAGWVHRFNTREDMIGLLGLLARTLREDGSLCRAYQLSHHEDAAEQLESFVDRLRSQAAGRLGKNPRARSWKGAGPAWFLPTPADGSTCKRLLMWLRWMIRKDEIDPGTWQDARLKDGSLPSPDPARLFWPVDTHVFKWAREAKLVSRKSPNWEGTLELTRAFRALVPTDPVRYDFAVCHAGMTAFRSK
jgi:uncharacterized protein (TIGR02757 family)